MDNEFLMGVSDGLERSSSDRDRSTSVSARLRARLVKAAMEKACGFYSRFFDRPIPKVDYSALASEYEHAFTRAISFGLLRRGGVREKDHLNLWCLARVLSPEVYVESGVFIGSSLHAFVETPDVARIIAIDPDIHQLRIPKDHISKVELVSDRDFSQIEVDFSGEVAFVYFDDHIDTADRIVQAWEKGFRYALFDDSTGMEGICQRLYPAIPTIPMIMNPELLNPGDEMSWSFSRPSAGGLRGLIKRLIPGIAHTESIRIALSVDQKLIDKCHKARGLIKKCERVPDLGEFIPQMQPERMVDTSKFIVELEDG